MLYFLKAESQDLNELNLLQTGALRMKWIGFLFFWVFFFLHMGLLKKKILSYTLILSVQFVFFIEKCKACFYL